MRSGILLTAAVAAFSAATASATPEPARNDRMAAWQKTMVAIDEAHPNAWLGTYMMDRFAYMEHYGLAKFVPSVEINGRSVATSRATDIQVTDFPGGVRATYRIESITLSVEITPLLFGWGKTLWEGAAYYSISAEPRIPVTVRFGGSDLPSFDRRPRTQWMQTDDLGSTGDDAVIENKTAVLRSKTWPLTVSATCSGLLGAAPGDNGGRIAEARFDSGAGTILVAYARDAARAVELASGNALALRGAVQAHYDKLMACRIETPEKLLDEAFSTALYNVEYNYLYPYGWNECIHHWLAMWHMQPAGLADWIGQAERSRDCNLVTAENLMSSGAVPQFNVDGTVRRDFGGSNQFFAWQVRHNWLSTADIQTIRKLAPVMDRVAAQTFEEYDRDRNGLLAWGQQIGNQEDYVSTPFDGASPSVEGINILRTTATLHRALGDEARALTYQRHAQASEARLRSELWMSDLGRFAFHNDPYGYTRPDGQYHTQIYPVIWGILDPLDSYSSIRHLRDRMTGFDGEIYCSNNFPNHVRGTWGMQGGAAQQPWAAWGLSAVGLRNETFEPLMAAARWAMSADHKGSWPEVADEPTACYFSPPAALYAQACIEALFGLTLDKPAGVLNISPSLPDNWPQAKLTLPDFSAVFSRKANTIDYTVTSRELLARKLRWMLPPCRLTRVLVNGAPGKARIEPGVGCVTVCVDAPRSKRTRFTLVMDLVDYTIKAPASVAEGDKLLITVKGVTIADLDDRTGLIAKWKIAGGTSIEATLREDILKPYQSFGRLGLMNFSRRTLFLNCVDKHGTRFWSPVDTAILPRIELAARGEVSWDERARQGALNLTVRNNTSEELSGEASIAIARSVLPFEVRVAARSEIQARVEIPAEILALLSPGDNQARARVPGQAPIAFTVTARALFAENPALAQYAKRRISPVRLPAESLRPDSEWRSAREFYAYGHLPWAWLKDPMSALEGISKLPVPEIPGLEFEIEHRKLAFISRRLGKPDLTIDLDGKPYRKIYILAVPFLDNHDAFSRVAQVALKTKSGGIMVRTLSFPGDLDWWCPQEIVGDFSTARNPRPDRLGLPPMLGPNQGDWKAAKPPAFPQPEYWAGCVAVKTATAVMNIIEIDPGQALPISSLTISTLGADPALGIVAIAGEKAVGQETLAGTPWMPAPALREPRPVFTLNLAEDAACWRFEGNAFAMAAIPQLPSTVTLNSMMGAGETGVGKAISPDFEILPQDGFLRMIIQGGNSASEDGEGLLAIDLVDAVSNERLCRMKVTGSHGLREAGFPVKQWQGRRVRLELTDMNRGTAYAWLGLSEVTMNGD